MQRPTLKQRASIALVAVSLLSFISNWEGSETVAYADKLANGLPTVCNGHTGPDVRVGDVWSKERCDAVLRKDVHAHGAAILDCITVPINQNEYEAYASLAYNVGVSSICKSTAIRLLNEGKHLEACDQILRWNRASGREVRGLTNRRKAERELCRTPIAPVQTEIA